MIVITGATGNLGRRVVDGLLAALPPAQVGVSVRSAAKAADLAARGVRVVEADFAAPATLAAAFDGADQVLLVSVNAVGPAGVEQHRNAIAAAKAAGVRRILYTGHQGAGAASLFAPIRDNHAPTEALLQASGVPFVSLSNGFYAESALFQLTGMQQTGTLALPADGPVNWTARNDLADAATALLLHPDALDDGISPPLTGSESLDFTATAALASAILQQPITRQTIPDETYRAGLIAHGLPPHMADLLLTLYTAARTGEFNVIDPTLERLLGRKPATMQSVLEAYLTGPQTPLFQQR